MLFQFQVYFEFPQELLSLYFSLYLASTLFFSFIMIWRPCCFLLFSFIGVHAGLFFTPQLVSRRGWNYQKNRSPGVGVLIN